MKLACVCEYMVFCTGQEESGVAWFSGLFENCDG
jgi:hypothetical protein